MSLFGLDTDTILNISIVLSVSSIAICVTLFSLRIRDWMRDNGIRVLAPHILVLESERKKSAFYEILHVTWTFLGLKVMDRFRLHTMKGSISRVEDYATLQEARNRVQMASL